MRALPLLFVLSLLACEQRRIEAYPEALSGIGVILKQEGQAHLIQDVIEGGPAAQMGLSRGDLLLRIDGAPLSGRALATVTEKLRGAEGSSVLLEIDRAGLRLSVLVPRKRLVRSREGVSDGQKNTEYRAH